VTTIREIAVRCREEVEKLLAPIDSLSPDERNTALDWIQELPEQSDAYATLVSDILGRNSTSFRSVACSRQPPAGPVFG
jgi:hypothetical protein